MFRGYGWLGFTVFGLKGPIHGKGLLGLVLRGCLDGWLVWAFLRLRDLRIPGVLTVLLKGLRRRIFRV